ncbi:unnamed protein product [Rhodiola kirilowii]
MESEKKEALKAKETAERMFMERNYLGAKGYALEAQSLCPELDGVSQMVATFSIYVAAEARVNGEIDYYSMLGLPPTADDNKVKKQFNKMAVLLQNEKNKCVGADGALELVSEAWAVLSDRAKRAAYDVRMSNQVPSQSNQTSSSSVRRNAAAHIDRSQAPPMPHHRLDTFWTVCTSCRVQYEYLRKYLNKKLSCKNCRGVFMAVETGVTPLNGSYPFYTWSTTSTPTNGYASNGASKASNYQSNAAAYNGNGVPIGHGSEYSSNLSFQWSSGSKTSAGVVIHNGLSSISGDQVYKTKGKVKLKSNEKRKLADQDIRSFMKTGSFQVSSNLSTAYRNPLLTKDGRIDKRRRVDTAAVLKSLFEDTGSVAPCEVKLPNTTTGATANHGLKASISSEPHARRSLVAPQLDIRSMLLNKAKTEIKKKLEEITSPAEAAPAAEKNMTLCSDSFKSIELDKKSEPISFSVPDPDFHDFDKDRSEQCFKTKQIWALYDEEEGMPRLYCMIRQVLSLDPFMIDITYLNSKTCSEFGSVDWIAAGFTKSCGNFKTMNSDTVDQVNIFSHVLSDETKAGRGGRVRIYPKTGDIWAVYRNWSPDWDSFTPEEVRRQYDMVVVVDDYSEQHGVPVFPLVKVEGYNTVYRRSADENATRWVPKQEMFRFSHQVPSWPLEGDEYGLPDGCWDLDPAATPDDLLHSFNKQAPPSSKCITEPASKGLHYSDVRPGQQVKGHTEGDQHHAGNQHGASEEP